MFGFFKNKCQKIYPTLVKSFLKITIGNEFLEGNFFDRNMDNLFFLIVIIKALIKIAFKIDFGPQEVPKLEIMPFHYHFSG